MTCEGVKLITDREAPQNQPRGAAAEYCPSLDESRIIAILSYLAYATFLS